MGRPGVADAVLTSEKPLGVAEQMRRAAKASNADEAIAILETRPDIHVVFTDIQMAGSMDGLKLAHFVRGRWPDQDHRDFRTSCVQRSRLPEGSRFLPKPYGSDSISSILRELTSQAL